jgi:RNA polymerase sigma factor (sigma-70 family)
MNDFELDDAALLDRLARGERSALAEIARRHIDLVHAAARRQTRDAHLADDVTQAVFLTLTRKAGSIRKGTNLVGWLYMTTRNIALTARRATMRRDRHEQAASVPGEAETADEETILPLLDDAIHTLPSADREAVLLRFFGKLPFADVGERLGTTEEGARKRVTRAIEKLRTQLAARGATASVVAVTTLLAAESAKAAPPATIAGVTGTASPAALALAATTVAVSTSAKIVASVAAVLVVGAIATSAVFVARRAAPSATAMNVLAGDATNNGLENLPSAQRGSTDNLLAPLPWYAAFKAAYGLEQGQVVKRVSPPFIPERMGYFRWFSGNADANPQTPGFLVLDSELMHRRCLMGGFTAPDPDAELDVLREMVCDLRPYQFQLQSTPEIQNAIAGDWVVDRSAPQEQRITALAAQLQADTKRNVTCEKVEETGEVIVVTQGGSPSSFDLIDIKIEGAETVGRLGTSGPLEYMLKKISIASRWPIIDERSPDSKQGEASVAINHDGKLALGPDERSSRGDIEAVMKPLCEQTGLAFRIEKRTYAVWKMSVK